MLSWNEIDHRASEFASKWRGETYEKGESQSFWSDFLEVFGIDRRRHGALFEYPVKKLGNKQGFIDMFWPGMLLAEQKSGGRDLSAANIQAFDYLHGIKDEDLPKYIVVSDFAHFDLINLETREKTSFTLEDLPKKIKLFGFLIGRDSENPQEEDPVNRKAAESMARLHNQLRDANFTGHELELLLVRLMFCLFADDAGIFERGSFEKYLRGRTSPDGSDLGSKLSKIFEILNTDIADRQTNLDEDLAALPYVNGGLFAEFTRTPDFTSAMRTELIKAADLDWSQVSPAIFGSMFQGVMDEKARRNLGAHYTSERNIMKVIKPLFLDELYAEFEKVRRSKTKLKDFHEKLASLTFLDPACGCGNFLVITYRELRKLEHKVLGAIHGKQALLTNVTDNIKVDVDQMYGIEIEEFPALIAQTALWLTDHQMNLAASAQFGKHFNRLPLVKTATIANVNALTTDWKTIIAPEKLSYILGNPPFLGHHLQTVEQKAQMVAVLEGIKAAGIMDFVSAWYYKASEYIKNTGIKVALVSTNSITQGEQVGILWSLLLEKFGIKIHFAHQTFRWSNEGKDVAAVYCVIIGFAGADTKDKQLFTYETVKSEPVEISAKNINPYLVDAPDVTVENRSKPLCDVPKMMYGNKPTDGGHFLLTDGEKQAFIAGEPEAAQFIKPFISAKEFLNNEKRWVIWLVGADPSTLKRLPLIMERIERVRQFRQASKAASTRGYPYHTLFRQVTQPKSSYILIPAHSSENRDYIPMGFMSQDEIISNSCFAVVDATLYHFGILTSAMHMAWVNAVCGRLESRYRYSKDIVYNNFPWPENVTAEQTANIEQLAQAILDTRAEFPNSSLADLYDPRTMPPVLAKAHQNLDKAADKLYGSIVFKKDTERVALLFKNHQRTTGDS